MYKKYVPGDNRSVPKKFRRDTLMAKNVKNTNMNNANSNEANKYAASQSKNSNKNSKNSSDKNCGKNSSRSAADVSDNY